MEIAASLPLALGLRAKRFASFDSVATSEQLRAILHSCSERITPLTESDAPVGDSAGGVLGQGCVEFSDRVGELERVQQRDGGVEGLSWSGLQDVEK